MFVVSTELKGHFLSYAKIIDDHSDGGVVNIFFEGRGLVSNIFFIVRNIRCRPNEEKKIFFLNGEQFLLTLIVKLLFPRYKVSSIIYHSFLGVGLRALTKKTIFCISSMCGIFLYFLEGEEWVSRSKCLFKSGYRSLRDPALLDHKSFSSKEVDPNVVTYLVVGYIDERKCVPEIVQALIALAFDSKVTQRLIILGKQSLGVENYLSGLVVPKGLELLVLNQRFSDDEYSHYLAISDVVLAIYKNHFGSSGVVINSILYGKKVLFIPVGVTADFEARLALDGLPQSTSPDAIKGALVKLVNSVQYDDSARLSFLVGRSKKDFYLSLIR